MSDNPSDAAEMQLQPITLKAANIWVAGWQAEQRTLAELRAVQQRAVAEAR